MSGVCTEAMNVWIHDNKKCLATKKECQLSQTTFHSHKYCKLVLTGGSFEGANARFEESVKGNI
jgi:hypothetical protein